MSVFWYSSNSESAISELLIISILTLLQRTSASADNMTPPTVSAARLDDDDGSPLSHTSSPMGRSSARVNTNVQ
jgi:hypothetical protein